jgi:hypothetical protein
MGDVVKPVFETEEQSDPTLIPRTHAGATRPARSGAVVLGLRLFQHGPPYSDHWQGPRSATAGNHDGA